LRTERYTGKGLKKQAEVKQEKAVEVSLVDPDSGYMYRKESRQGNRHLYMSTEATFEVQDDEPARVSSVCVRPEDVSGLPHA
jgi:hypothetical protein